MTKKEYENKVRNLAYMSSNDKAYEENNLRKVLDNWKKSHEIAIAKIAQLQADNRSLVEQMNKMAMKIKLYKSLLKM